VFKVSPDTCLLFFASLVCMFENGIKKCISYKNNINFGKPKAKYKMTDLTTLQLNNIIVESIFKIVSLFIKNISFIYYVLIQALQQVFLSINILITTSISL